jgi:hypothetical protein
VGLGHAPPPPKVGCRLFANVDCQLLFLRAVGMGEGGDWVVRPPKCYWWGEKRSSAFSDGS